MVGSGLFCVWARSGRFRPGASSKPAARKYFGFVYWPGLMMQKLTTREPSVDQLEVAIAALNASLADNLLESRQFID